MAIQMRRGANSDFNPSKMLPGEIAITTDGTRKVYAAFRSNDVKELASKEDVQGLINGFTSVVDREIAEAEQRIESKGQQVLETIPDLYEEVSARADEAVRTKADAIVCTVSGVNPVAKDSSNDYLRNLKLYGKTTQPTTKGKNLLDSTLVSSAKNGITCTKNDDGSYTFNGKATSRTQFNFSTDIMISKKENICFSVLGSNYPSEYTIYLSELGTNTPVLGANTQNYATGLNEYPNSTLYAFIVFAEGTVVSNMTIFPQIEYGTTPTEYEPYTGGIASPSTQYPQPLESNGKWGNLLENTLESQTISGLTITRNKDGSITINGTVTQGVALPIGKVALTKGEKYKLSGCPVGGSTSTFYIYKQYGDEKYAFDIGNGAAFTEEGETKQIHLVVVGGTTVNNLTFYPQLTYAEDNISSYRPYTGQREIESGVYGKNLFKPTLKTCAINGIDCTKNTDGSYTFNGTATAKTQFNFSTSIVIQKEGDVCFSILGSGYPSNYVIYLSTLSTNTAICGANTVNFATGKNNYPNQTLYAFVVFTEGTVVSNMTVSPQIEYGTTPTPYEPYTKQSHISLVGDGLKGMPIGTDPSAFPDVIKNNPVHMDGVYWDEEIKQYVLSDTVDCERGVLVQRIKKIVFDTTMKYYVSKASNGTIRWFTTFEDIEVSASYSAKPNILCNIAQGVPWYIIENDVGSYIAKTVGGTTVYIGISFAEVQDITDEASFKAWLESLDEPIVVYAILKEPIITPLSASELASYKALKSNYKVTSVMNDCECFEELQYNADTKTYIDNKFAALAAQLL